MMSFNISVERIPNSAPDDPLGIEIAADGHVYTRLLRGNSNAIETRLLARPAQLAFWLVDNWWRLRWESMPVEGPSSQWRLAHDFSAIGGGTIWPRLYVWGEGARVGLKATQDAIGVVGPVRFLEHGLSFVPSVEWEGGVNKFLEEVQDEASGFGSDRAALRAQFIALREERANVDVAVWRRVEARLGFDVDQAPEALVEALFEIAGQYDEAGMEEAIQAAPGVGAADILAAEVEAAKGSRLIGNFSDACDAAGRVQWIGDTPVWEPGELAASKVRRAAGRPEGPLRNKDLAEILGTSATALTSTKSAPSEKLVYGLRLSNTKERDGSQVISLRSWRSHDRRFEFARALGDAIWAGDSRLGPLTQTKTDRQRFQRAFAQSLLCPFDELREFIDENGSDDEGIMAAAEHYHVNTKVIERTLVKKRILLPRRFEDLVEAA